MIQIFIDTIKNSWNNQSFIKLSLSKYKGSEVQLKNIYIKKIMVKKEEKLSFTYHYQTNDIVKNYSFDEALFFFNKYIDPLEFQIANLFTLSADYALEYNTSKTWKLKELKPSFTTLPSSDHDKQKQRSITSIDKTYLHALNITDQKGNVLHHAQDKYKQINHYIEILSSLFKELPSQDLLKVVDMGSGKGYLTFALYDYLTHILQRPSAVIGVELRKELVDLCNQIAVQSNFDHLKFIEGYIDTYHDYNFDVLIALHACDTATDDAIYQGIMADAALIVVAPCCHKQIRREMEKYKTKTDLDDILRHGIYLERQAEMITDSIRALILENHGYKVKVFDFISDAHTPKNIMITAQKKYTSINEQVQLEKINKLKSMFGIKTHYLETKFLKK